MITTTKKNLEERLDQLDSEIEEVQDRIAALKNERSKIADQLDDLIDQEEH